jgi:hypothetical protein
MHWPKGGATWSDEKCCGIYSKKVEFPFIVDTGCCPSGYCFASFKIDHNFQVKVHAREDEGNLEARLATSIEIGTLSLGAHFQFHRVRNIPLHLGHGTERTAAAPVPASATPCHPSSTTASMPTRPDERPRSFISSRDDCWCSGPRVAGQLSRQRSGHEELRGGDRPSSYPELEFRRPKGTCSSAHEPSKPTGQADTTEPPTTTTSHRAMGMKQTLPGHLPSNPRAFD